jgi:hypothetical protein
LTVSDSGSSISEYVVCENPRLLETYFARLDIFLS